MDPKADPPPRQTPGKTLPCPKLRLRAVKMHYFTVAQRNDFADFKLRISLNWAEHKQKSQIRLYPIPIWIIECVCPSKEFMTALRF